MVVGGGGSFLSRRRVFLRAAWLRASPVFAALVLKCILSNIKREMGQDAAIHANAGDLSNDGIGGILSSMH